MAEFCGVCGCKLNEAGICLECNSSKRGRKKLNKKQIIVLSSIVVLVVAGFLIAFFFFNSENTKEKEVAKQDLTLTFEAILNRSEKTGYVVGINATVPTSLLNDNEISDEINSRISYKIDSIKLKEEKGTVTISVVSPDIHTILMDIDNSDNAVDNPDILFDEINHSLASEHPKFTAKVEVKIEKIGEHWFVIPNSELANALSGNLIQSYSKLGNDVINELIGSESND